MSEVFSNPVIMEQLDDNQVSYEAAKFATVTHLARSIVPFMEQEFEVRIKSSKLCFNQIRQDLDDDELAASLLGKTIKVKVDWSCLNSYMWIRFKYRGKTEFILLNSDNFRKVITQFSLPIAMFELWKKAAHIK